MARCLLCYIRKTTTWYKDGKGYAILDCPVCEEKLIISKNHEDEAFEENALTMAERFMGKPVSEIKNYCFATAHPYLHFKIKPDKKTKKEVLTKDSIIKTEYSGNLSATTYTPEDYIEMHHDQ